MINSIKLENIATYASVEFSGLQRQNFIYGANGSGKTTLSNYLADSTNLAYSDCSTTWENNTPLEILVYNKNFRQKHFNSTGKIPGIFTIGEKSQEIAKEIEAKNKELESLKTNITTYKSTQGTKQDEIDNLYIKFKDNVWDRLYKKHELAFKEAFKGVMSNKDNFVNKVLSEYETLKNETALDYENLKKLSDKIYNSPNEKFSDLSDFPNINLEEVMQNPIYSKKIIGNKDVDIAPLINKLNNSDWVNAGRDFLSTDDKICPFCQQETISDKFIKELASFFDETYTKDLNTLKEASDLYKVNSKNLLDFLDEIEKSQTSNNNTQLNLTLFFAHLKTLHSEVSQNLAKISSKEKEPSLAITLQSHKETVDAIKNILELARQKIKEHNDIIDTLAKQKEDLKNKIWCYLIKENETFIAQYNKNKQDCKKAISALTQKMNKCKIEISALNEELRELNKKDISTEAAVDNINDILRNYGFMNFQIVSAKDENTYTLKREDESLIKDNLSEGEETFITFLYYMQLVHGSLNDDGIQKEKVLVIDDPISSLDSNVLFIVSSLIKEELKKLGDANNKIKQIIILTHNIYFYKEISFIDGRENTRNDLSYWIIRKEELISTTQKYEKNPIVSSYDLYWREIREHKKDGKCNIYIQNTMRRIIEHYFKVLGKYTDTSLLNKFENPNEKSVARSLLSWINVGSHSLPEDLFMEEPEQITNNYFEVFKQIFVKTNQESHYEMMMSIEE